jgi:hypothetical protein
VQDVSAQCEIERTWRGIRSAEGAVSLRSERERTSFDRYCLFDAFAAAQEREGYQSACCHVDPQGSAGSRLSHRTGVPDYSISKFSLLT